MKVSIKPVFQCDFCDKRLFRKDAMERHELICSRNPLNKDACHGCQHCEEIQKEIISDNWAGGFYREESRMVKSFQCTKLKQAMYPHKAEPIASKYPESFEGEIVMPNDCVHYLFKL